MKRIGFIPLRKGSKSIPDKNKKKILGRPLYSWILGEAIKSSLDEVYVFTDDEKIIEQVKTNYKWSNKIKVLERSTENAEDTSSTESAMLEFSKIIGHNYDLITLLQATSPLTDNHSINKVVGLVESNKFDSALSVVEIKRFFWDSKGRSLNYDFTRRPRRQDFNGTLVENGAIYTCSKNILLKTQNRLGGKIGLYKMPEETFIEIDEPHDFTIIETLLKARLTKEKGDLTKIKALVLDVDGVFTKGEVTYSNEGEFSKTFNMRDGMGLEIARENNIMPIILTSENTPIVSSRMKKLGIEHVYLGVKDKYATLQNICKEKKLTYNEITYIGDDVNDLANICSVGWGICPNDAVNEVKNSADLVLNHNGGAMAIRETVNFLIKYNTRFNE